HLFPRRIHAVTAEGFVLKVLTFVLAHNIRLIANKIA
ncbi:MAG: IS982 family transposase, partial [Deinococcota bacterium]